MNEWFKKIFAKIKELWAKWSIVQKIILIGIVVAVVGLIIIAFSFSSSPSTEVLFPVSDETQRENIIAVLAKENIKVTVNSTTNELSVENATARRRAIAILEREDLTPGNVDPWVLFDIERWTTTDFERNINLQRSITDAITRQIESIDDIEKAVVTLNMPKKELLKENQEPASCAVTLMLKPGSDFASNKKKIKGVQGLILKGLPGMNAENLVIADTSGNILNDFEGMAEIERVDILKREQKFIDEKTAKLRGQILESLAKMFTLDRLSGLNVVIEMDMSKEHISATEHTPIIMKEDNPDTPYDDSIIRESITISEQVIEKKWTGTAKNPEGPAGVEGQNPPVYSDMSNLIGTSEETSRTHNEVVNTKQITKEVSPQIKRITVSVGIDGKWKLLRKDGKFVIGEDGWRVREYTPVTQIELDSVKNIVEKAAGCNKERGDEVVVEHIQFDRQQEFEENDNNFFKQEETKRTVVYILSGIAIVLLAFLIVRIVSREMERRRRERQEKQLRELQMQRDAMLINAGNEDMDVTMSVEERRRAELQENAITMAREHPEDVAMLIRTWLMEE
ncbi:MAG: flagellar M-ring protein FliF [Treponema sp.]|nr:flagellar M-ring protein FliF [Treponema sp.]